MKFMPKSLAGRLSVILTAISLLAIIIFFITMLCGIVNFESRLWDVCLCICVVCELFALIFSITALIRFSDKTISVFISLILSSLSIAFVLVHSLFIKD
ncbi:MAG TPA: hypothetical protein PLT91_00500 [Clostridia bacterium]|nr:MAG: hypothetical protein BWX97_00227 [Firmicutes bacterium ADurb.Bin146]HQM38701.1 hypothetical protein [Clostridia bacterium]